MSAVPSEKALRLLVEGRVEPDTAAAPQVFHVDGDHGRYVVVVGAHVQMCSCPARDRCSHIEAASARVWATDSELALMDEALAARRNRVSAEAETVFARLA